jgi:hypothetical protein
LRTQAGLRSTCNGVVRGRGGARTRRVSRFFVNGAPGCVCAHGGSFSRVLGRRDASATIECDWLAEGSFVQCKSPSATRGEFQYVESRVYVSRGRSLIPKTRGTEQPKQKRGSGLRFYLQARRKCLRIRKNLQARRKCLTPAEDKDEPDSDARRGYVPAGVSSRITTPEPESLSR